MAKLNKNKKQKISGAFGNCIYYAVSALVFSCCASSGSSERKLFSQSQEAFSRGKVWKSYRMLRNVTPGDGITSENFNELLTKVTNAAEHLITQFLERGDFWEKNNDLPKALQYYQDITDQLPTDDPLRQQLSQKAKKVQKKIIELQTKIAELVEDGENAFREENYSLAQSNLMRARYVAADSNLPFSMPVERLLEEATRRLPEKITEGRKSRLALRAFKKNRDKQKVRLKKLRRRRQNTPKEGNANPKPEKEATKVEISKLLTHAKTMQKQSNLEQAIVAFTKIVVLDPSQQ